MCWDPKSYFSQNKYLNLKYLGDIIARFYADLNHRVDALITQCRCIYLSLTSALTCSGRDKGSVAIQLIEQTTFLIPVASIYITLCNQEIILEHSDNSSV